MILTAPGFSSHMVKSGLNLTGVTDIRGSWVQSRGSWVVGAKSVVPLVPWGFEGQSFLVSNIK